MSEVKLAAETRTEFGKGAARRTRRAGQVPGVVYGHGADPVHVDAAGPRAAARAAYPERPARPGRSTARPSWSSRRPCSATPIKGFLEHVDLLAREARREGHRRDPGAHRGRAGPGRQPARARAEHAAGRGRGHPHPRVASPSPSRAWRPVPPSSPRTSRCRRAPRWPSTSDAVVLQVVGRAGRGAGRRGRGRRGARPPRPEPRRTCLTACRRPLRPARPRQRPVRRMHGAVTSRRRIDDVTTDDGALADRGPRQSRARVRRQPAQRRLHGGRPAGRADRRAVQAGAARRRRRWWRGGSARRAGEPPGGAGQADVVHEPVRRSGDRAAGLLQGADGARSSRSTTSWTSTTARCG